MTTASPSKSAKQRSWLLTTRPPSGWWRRPSTSLGSCFHPSRTSSQTVPEEGTQHHQEPKTPQPRAVLCFTVGLMVLDHEVRHSFYLQALRLLKTWTGLTSCSDSPRLSTHHNCCYQALIILLNLYTCPTTQLPQYTCQYCSIYCAFLYYARMCILFYSHLLYVSILIFCSLLLLLHCQEGTRKYTFCWTMYTMRIPYIWPIKLETWNQACLSLTSLHVWTHWLTPQCVWLGAFSLKWSSFLNS